MKVLFSSEVSHQIMPTLGAARMYCRSPPLEREEVEEKGYSDRQS